MSEWIEHYRGFWEQRLEEELLRSRRTHEPCSLILFDIDLFKDVNDEFGHQAGDAVIRAAAEEVRAKVRATDIPGRYGGEEFGIVLIDTTAESARFLAERLRKSIETLSVDYDDDEISFTISLGVAEISDEMKDYREWLEYADRALYSAKDAGRNQVVLYQEDS